MRRKKKAKAKSKMNALGLFQVLLFTTFFYLLNGVASNPLETQSVAAEDARLPFRPIGSASAVDQYSHPGQVTETAYHAQSGDRWGTSDMVDQPVRAQGMSAPVRQVAMQSGGFSSPPPSSGFAPQVPTQFAPPPLSTPPQMSPNAASTPPSDASPLSPPSLEFDNTPPPATSMPSSTPRSLPSSSSGGSPPSGSTYASPPIADYEPVMPPQLSNGGFATAADCRLITPPSTYTGMSPYGDLCSSVAPTNYTSPYTPPPAEIAAPAAMPPLTAAPPVAAAPPITVPSTAITVPSTAITVPQTVPPVSPPASAPVGSLMTFGQESLPVQVGQGLWGQPVAYVPGQRCRNWLRYFSF
ncbi:hypothetical protein [Allorhodopirellula solitaria]|uniref:Uncharacterized protein n=1 Tax=Allorhodopirellula solitaria TaxID=2527987 RepID=A0A5C5X053_9BACT|nr:hypothetical protein [Allorhodopirellula solitaria]TWT56367.1 hypothetical protein CA85_43700 [Allorhodopirellula solitaria]